jgi:hypothetical protein
MPVIVGVSDEEKLARLIFQIERAVACVSEFAQMREQLLEIKKAAHLEDTVTTVDAMLQTCAQYDKTARKVLDSLTADLRRAQSQKSNELTGALSLR